MKKELEIYLHIPFCVRKCKYCDFLSAPSTLTERELYIASLVKKMESYREFAKEYVVSTIFIGGGTPSLLSNDQMRSIFDALNDVFEVDEDCEITIEVNPGTVTLDKLLCYREIGINRLSIGLQSTKNTELQFLGRIHQYSDFEETYQLARKVSFDNINIDLMSALPGQTLESYKETLHTVASLNPEHISAYSLIIEEGTPFFDIYGEDQGDDADYPSLPDEDCEREMYQCTEEILESYGYHRYEISNYAKDGKECRHNLGYWERKEYLGIGFGAASLIGNKRMKEPEDYWDFEGESKNDAEVLTKEDEMSEFMFLGLRKIKGISKLEFAKAFSEDMEDVFGEVIQEMVGKGLLLCEGDFVRLTKRGLDVSNYVMSEFLL